MQKYVILSIGTFNSKMPLQLKKAKESKVYLASDSKEAKHLGTPALAPNPLHTFVTN